jgi:NADH:ubiquinone oxidoreductase subunit K/NADH:ubiquinone oxidoreductase subunit 6 (subunit J)
MIVALLVFYLLSAVAVAAGVMVISARNPVHSVLFLILAFFNAAGLFVLIGAEFLAMVLVVVYVGAVAVLFLFVVMMLDINFIRLREGFLQYLPIGGLIGLILLVELILVLGHRRYGLRRAAGAGGENQHRGSGRPVLHRLLLPVPGGRPDPPGRDHRRDHADLAPQAGRPPPGHRRAGPSAAGRRAAQGPARERDLMAVPLAHYLTVAAILFTLGIFGIFLNRKNVIIILMSIELMLLAINLNFVAFSAYLGDLAGQVFAMFVLTVAAAEAAIGLAILVVYFRNRGSIEVEDINLMRG